MTDESGLVVFNDGLTTVFYGFERISFFLTSALTVVFAY